MHALTIKNEKWKWIWFSNAMASPFHFGTESCYIFDFFLLAISLTTIFQYGRSSIFGKCNHYFLGTGQASCPTTWWCCPWTPQRPLPPSSWSRSSTSTAGTTPTKLLPPSPPPPTVLKYVHNPNTGRTSCAPAAWTLMLSSLPPSHCGSSVCQ